MGRGKRARSLCLPESDIFGLVYSLRPAFLVEFFSSDSEIEFQLQQLSSKFEESSTLLCALRVNQDYLFVVNVPLLLEKCEKELLDEMVFVNISEDRPKPEICDAQLEDRVRKSLCPVISKLQFLLTSTSISSNTKTKVISFELQDTAKQPGLIVSFFGWILDFPFIYVLLDGGRVAGNNLGSVPLQLTEIKVDWRRSTISNSGGHHLITMASFSIPVECTSPATEAILLRFKKKLMDRFTHPSYTYLEIQNRIVIMDKVIL